MTTALDMAAFESLLVDALSDGFANEVESWLADPRRTAHRLVTATTAELVEQALGGRAEREADAPVLPSGLWRVLPDRLLALHPARRSELAARRQISVAQHLELTAAVLEQWGWAQPGRHNRTAGGARCPKGAQYALYRLGYGTEVTVAEADRRIQGVLADRGITRPFWEWNDQADVTGPMVLSVVRAAAGVT
jgi:hypothetical protein